MAIRHSQRCIAISVAVAHVLATLAPVTALADPAPPGVEAANANTQVYLAPNGVPIVNIANPNATGLSHNQYTQFNVDSRGVVLNNGTPDQLQRQSQLAGATLSNLNLTNSASIILNEVTSANRSVLAGFTEVLGSQADVIVANPFGITCSGCGFINTDRVMLTTGAPRFGAGGALAGFDVRGGDVLVSGAGLDATSQSYFDVLARAARLEAQLNARDLRITTGANAWDYATRQVSAGLTGDGQIEGFAFDSTLLGGVYADRIRIVATEQGVGVRALGDLAATADDFRLDAAGRIELRGRLSAQRDASVTTTDGNATAILVSDATLSAGRDLALDSGNAGGIALEDGSLNAGAALRLTGSSLSDTSATAATRFGAGDVRLSFLNAATIDGSVWGAGGELVAEVGSLTLGGAQSRLYSGANENAPLRGLSIRATSGGIDAGSASILSPGSLELIAEQGAVTLGTGGELVARDLRVDASALANGGRLLADTLQISATDLQNSGLIQATNGASIDAGTLANLTAAARILTSTTGTGAGAITVSGALSNAGLIHGRGDLAISGGSIVNSASGGLSSLGTLSLAGSGDIVNGGSIFAGLALNVVTPTGAFRNVGTAGGTGGTVIAGDGGVGDMFFDVDTFSNTGAVIAGNDIRIETRLFHNDPVGGMPTIVAGPRVWDMEATPRPDCFPPSGDPSPCLPLFPIQRPPYLHPEMTNVGFSDGFNCDVFGNDCAFSWMWRGSFSVTDQLVGPAPQAAQLIADGDIVVNYREAGRNRASIISGDNITLSGPTAFLNEDLHLQTRQFYVYVWERWGDPGTQWFSTANPAHFDPTRFNDDEPGYEPLDPRRWPEFFTADLAAFAALPHLNSTVDHAPTLDAGIYGRGAVVVTGGAINRGGTFTPTIVPPAPPAGAVPTISLPTSPNGFFVPSVTPGSRYLIETNPLYTSGDALGSDYLAGLLGFDAETLQQRLGDANYEAKLIRDQLIAQTGRNILTGYASESAQVKTLMENAAAQAGDLGLTFGRALTPEQAAALEQDLVWMEEKEVGGRTVLVPVVYLAATTRFGLTSGAVIEGRSVDVRGEALVNEGGTIKAQESLTVDTTGDIMNRSGAISGGTVDLKSGGNIVNETVAEHRGNDVQGRTDIGREATIEARDALSIDAANNVVIKGADVKAGGDASISVGGNVLVDTIQDRQADKSQSGTTSTQTRSVTNIGSTVEAGGNVSIQAGNIATIAGSQVSAGGDASVKAGNNVNVVDRQDETMTHTRTESSGWETRGASVGRSNKSVDEITTTTTSVGSTIQSGGSTSLEAGKRVNVRGSDVEAGGNVDINAQDISVTAGQNSTTTTRHEEDSYSSIGVHADANRVGWELATEDSKSDRTETTTTAVTSTIKAGGDVNRTAVGGTLKDEGTQIEAGGNVTQSAKTIESVAAQNTHTVTSSYEKERTSLGPSIDYGVGDAIDQAKDGSTAGVASASGGPTVGNTLTYTKDSGSSSSTATQAVTGTIKAGGKVQSRSTQDTTLEGTQIEAGGDVDLEARNLDMKAAKDTTSGSADSEHLQVSGRIEIDASGKPGGSVSGEYGTSDEASQSSTAVTGSVKSGGNINVRTTGDTRLEGTQVESKGDTTIDAGGNVKLDAARSTASSSSDSMEVSGSVSLQKKSGGASGSYESSSSSSASDTAVTGTVNAGGNLTIKSGKDVTTEGTDLKAGGDASIGADGKVEMKEAVSTSSSESESISASASISGSRDGAQKGGRRTPDKDTTEMIGGGGGNYDSSSTATRTEKQTTIEAGGNVTVESKEGTTLNKTEVKSGDEKKEEEKEQQPPAPGK